MERGTRQLAVTNVSRKQPVLCADVQLALGQLVVLLPPVPQPSIITMNWISLSPSLNSWSHGKARRAWWVSVRNISVTMKTILYSDQNERSIKSAKTNTRYSSLCVSFFKSFQLLNAWAGNQWGFCTNSSKSWPCEEVFCIITLCFEKRRSLAWKNMAVNAINK